MAEQMLLLKIKDLNRSAFNYLEKLPNKNTQKYKKGKMKLKTGGSRT